MNPNDPSRRGFLFAFGSTIIGRLFFPGLGSLSVSASVPTEIAATSASPDPIRRLITTPSWSQDRSALIWTELSDDRSSTSTKMWLIDDDEERADAEKFYSMATWRRWSAMKQLEQILRNPGPWLIRWNHDGLYGWNFHFMRVADWDYMFGPGSDERICFSPDPADKDVIFVSDPAEAARCTSAQVLAFIPNLMKNYGFSETKWDYFEPVPQSDAQRDFRAEHFGLEPAKIVPT